MHPYVYSQGQDTVVAIPGDLRKSLLSFQLPMPVKLVQGGRMWNTSSDEKE